MREPKSSMALSSSLESDEKSSPEIFSDALSSDFSLCVSHVFKNQPMSSTAPSYYFIIILHKSYELILKVIRYIYSYLMLIDNVFLNIIYRIIVMEKKKMLTSAVVLKHIKLYTQVLPSLCSLFQKEQLLLKHWTKSQHVGQILKSMLDTFCLLNHIRKRMTWCSLLMN